MKKITESLSTILIVIYIPAREPSFAWNLIFSTKVNPLNLEFLNQAKNIRMVLPSSHIKMLGK